MMHSPGPHPRTGFHPHPIRLEPTMGKGNKTPKKEVKKPKQDKGDKKAGKK